MKETRVLLCCGAGMSSGFLATATAKAAAARNLNWYVTAKSQSVAIDEMPDYDICLLGPHFRSHYQEFVDAAKEMNSDVTIDVIPEEIYGHIDGNSMVDFAIEKLKKDGKSLG